MPTKYVLILLVSMWLWALVKVEIDRNARNEFCRKTVIDMDNGFQKAKISKILFTDALRRKTEEDSRD